MSAAAYDVVAIGNAIVDVIAPAADEFLAQEGLTKGSMMLIDEARAASLYGAMAAGLEASGGSAGNTVAGVASLGGKAAYIGKVAADQLGEVFSHDIRAIGVRFDTPYLENGEATGRSLINVTPDGQRTMSTFLGAANQLTWHDVDPQLIRDSAIVYMEGYLFDPPPARAAFEHAAVIAREAGRMISITLSDVFVVDRWRKELLAFTEQSVDIVFANENELKALFQTDDFDAAVEMLRPLVEIAAVTRSEKGSVILRGSETVRVEACPVEAVVDTTGAGDQYAAGFLYGLARNLPLETCARLGSLAAAEVIGHYGPRPQVSLRTLAEQAELV
ncbi:adenosine kinase [Caulobacter sp. 17J80-11]|uniref:adenosine kinase n=1 Tax=Caulobacter sp. 17J80-11 TaxID=2763502 RepID=UPI001CA38D3A|nr:adenosine kinase [Caulobacter sp. 17J80-11]